MYDLTWRHVRTAIVAMDKQQVVHILSVCVCVVLVIRHAIRLRHIAICGLSCSAIFFSTCQTARFSGGKKLLNIK